MNNTCSCCSGKEYHRCCGLFLEQGKHAKTAEQLMRSRYTAYSLGGYGEYLMNTWLNASDLGLSVLQLNTSESNWSKLDILEKRQKGNEAIVEFKAHYSNDSGKVQTLHERSNFRRINGRWFYVSGEIFD